MNSKKNIIIVSARRSGTHLATDLVVNNFGYESINYNYIDYTKFTDELDILEKSFAEGGKVTWTHLHDFRNYLKYKHNPSDNDRLDKIFTESKIIFVYRDVRDIINSCYHRPHIKSKYKSFDDFYTNFDFDGYELIDEKYDNIFELLLQYYKNWFSVYMSRELLGLDMEIISFEEIVEDYNLSLEKLGKFLSIEPTGIDVRLPNKGNQNITYTTNDFRKGKVNDWLSTMDNEFGTELGEKYDTDLGIGVDHFVNDTQIHKYHQPQRDKFYEKKWSKAIRTGLISRMDSELEQYKNRFRFFGEKGAVDLIENRYKDSIQKPTDFRYYHKVFYYDKYVLKFIYPLKATLDKKIFDTVIPIESKKVLLTIYKTHDILYENGIVPKLYHAGIYKGIAYVIQEKCEMNDILCEKYNFYPKVDDWSWPLTIGVYSKMLSHFNKALEHNILLTDIINPYNNALDKSGTLKYFDLDGIKMFDTRTEMINSEEYKNAIGILKEIETIGNNN